MGRESDDESDLQHKQMVKVKKRLDKLSGHSNEVSENIEGEDRPSSVLVAKLGSKRKVFEEGEEEEEGERPKKVQVKQLVPSKSTTKSSHATSMAPSSTLFSSLDSFLSIPSPIYVTSPPLQDKDSIFIAFAQSTTTPSPPSTLLAHLRRIHASDRTRGEAMCYMYAYRVLCAKKGMKGWEGANDDVWEIKEAAYDDGEKGGGETIRKQMEVNGVTDVVVVVARWFGGTLLGPARFKHMRTVTAQSLSLLEEHSKMQLRIIELRELDVEINDLLQQMGGKGEAIKDYDDLLENLDMKKFERLKNAKEKRKEFLQSKIVSQ